MTRRQKTRISYGIRDSYDSFQHRQGINTIQIDYEAGFLYSGGRDCMVKKWDLNLDDPIYRRNTVKNSYEDGNIDENGVFKVAKNVQPIDTSDWHSDWVNSIALMREQGNGNC